MNRICVMRFLSDIPCAVSCDGLFIGCAEDKGLTAAIPCAQHFFTFSSLPREGFALPLNMYIDVCAPKSCPEGIKLTRLPENELICSLKFPTLKRKMPCVLSRTDEGIYSVVLYYDAGVNVCFMKEDIVEGAARLSDDCKSFSTYAQGGYLIACADKTTAYAPKSDLKDIRMVENSVFSDGVIRESTAHPSGLTIEHSLTGEVSLKFEKKDEYPAFTLALCAKLGLREICMGLLAPSLAGTLGFEDIREFFGDFHHIDYDFSSRGRLALCYELSERIFELRLFDVELSGGRVANIAPVEDGAPCGCK